jgi:putative phosphoesterase
VIRLGLISDTHGLLRPQALARLAGCDHILHAGDIGDPAILEALTRIAPLTAVRGNNDHGPWAARLPETEVVQLGDALVYAIHDVHALDVDPAAAGFHAVVAGHSHRPSHVVRDGVHFINPGSAGPRRFRLPLSIATVTITGTELAVRLETLDPDG